MSESAIVACSGSLREGPAPLLTGGASYRRRCDECGQLVRMVKRRVTRSGVRVYIAVFSAHDRVKP